LQSTSLSYTRGSGKLKVFSGADLAADMVTRRSTTGVIAIVVEGVVSWTSRLCKTTALLTTEGKIIAASEGAKELVCLKLLLSELLFDFARITLILCLNNASAIKLTKNLEYHKRSKHIEV
jgi:hypothetical protein